MNNIAKGMSQKSLVVKITFVHPERISTKNVKDQLEFRFLLPEFIVEQNTGIPINNSTILYKAIPLLLRYDSKFSLSHSFLNRSDNITSII